MSTDQFKFKEKTKNRLKGETTWRAPSNIALIKYWGKHGIQLPENPSLSFTLSRATSETQLSFKPKKDTGEDFSFQVYFENKISPSFRPKIQSFFERIVDYVPFIKDHHFTIETENTFPHSSGIASSASGMAALALGIMDLEKQLNPNLTETDFFRKASFLARLGSGSAARSLYGPLTVWGSHPAIENSSDLYALANPFTLHEHFAEYRDTILIIDKGEKQVSSSLGHRLMTGHPFATNRYDQAFVNMELLVDILQKGDLEEFIKVVETEALTLHAMMMTSDPYFLLMKPNTLNVIESIWEYREDTDSKLCFTLDAGANVHLLYPYAEKEEVHSFIEEVLSSYCEEGNYLEDKLGNGPERVS